MHNLTQFKEYEVEFLTIANWLLHKGKITKDEQHTKYWYGLNRKLREVIEARYLAAHPGYDPQKVIPRHEVSKIAYRILSRDCFDADLTAQSSKHKKSSQKNWSTSESETVTTSSDSQSDAETSSSSETDAKTKKECKRQKKRKRRPNKKKRRTKESVLRQ